MSLQGKKSSNIFIAFIVILVYTQSVTSSINYKEIREDDEPSGEQPEEARTIREILEMFTNRTIHRPIYTFQRATEHLLRFGALLRIEILDTFGPLVYDYYDDYSIRQTEALYRVYQETLERKYNIFEIVPSILRNPDTRPTSICGHIHKHVHTCLKESSMSCMTMNKHDDPNPHSSLSTAIDVTRKLYKRTQIREKFRKGFSLPGILSHLKRGNLNLTVGLMSGLLHNVRYDSFDDEVRTAERNVMIMLSSEMLGPDQDEVLIEKDLLLPIHTVSDLLRELFERRKTARRTKDKNKYFAILSKHVVREFESISRNIELFGTVYDNNTIDIKYLLNLVLPPDVVDGDITDAKNYLLEKINDYDIVSKYLKVEKYQQSGPDQLLMEILGQMRDINFAVDLATALHVHARFWRQSHMINNLNELLELFDAYENLKNVPRYSGLMSLMDKIRNTLWDSKNVTVEILCNNPRACLRLGLKTVAKCAFINSETKNNIEELFHHLHKSEVIYDVEECNPAINSTEVTQTTQNPTTIIGQVITDLTTPEILTTEPSIKSDGTTMRTANGEETTATTTTEIPTELLTINTEDTTTQMTALTTEDDTETTKRETTDLTDSIEEREAMIPVTTESSVTPHVTIESTTELEATEEQSSSEQDADKSTTTVHTTLESMSEELSTEETTSTEQMSPRFTEKSTTDEEMRRTTETITTNSGESTTNLMTTDETIVPINDDDCYGEECHPEISDESIDDLSSGAWRTGRSPPPLSLAYNARTTKSMGPPITTRIPTATEDSTASTTATKVITTSSTGQKPGLSKKPKSYSANLSEENCSGEDCTSEDCSGDDCPEYSSPEVIKNSTDCLGTNCNMTDQTDCNKDGSCSPNSSNDTCEDSDCKSNITEQNYEQDCSDDGCSSTAEISQETEGCTGVECSTAHSEWDYSSTEIPLASTNASDCVGDDCSEDSKSNESNCNGGECPDRDEGRSSRISHETDPLQTTDAPSVRCDNKDPHHQRQLDRLKKIRIINALHAAALVPPSRVTDGVKDDDSSNELPPRRPMKYRPKLSYHDLQSWLNFPRNKPSKHSLPWRQSSHQSFQSHDIEEEEFGQQSIESEMVRTKNRTRTKAYRNRNRNTNINFISLRRYEDGDIGDGTTPEPLVLQKVDLPNGSYRRVVTRISKGLRSSKRNQKPQHESNANLRLKTPSKKSPDISRRREVSSLRMKPVVYRTKESNDNIERMRRNRSIIRAPQRASRRYLR